MISMLLASALAYAPAPSAQPAEVGPEPMPSVWIAPLQNPESDSGQESPLFGWLVVQLLAEGYALADEPAHAQIELAIADRGPDQGWQVVAAGQSEQAFEVDPAEDPAVAKLELLHRAFDALDTVQPRPAVESIQGRSFAIEFAPTVEGSVRSLSEEQIAVAVLESGGSIAPSAAAAQFVICVDPGTSAPRLELVAADLGCAARPAAPETAVVSPTGQRTNQLVTAALAMPAVVEPEAQVVTEPPAAAKPAPAAEFDEELPPGLEVEEQTPDRRRVWPDSKLVLRAGLAGGITGRVNAADAVIAGSLLIGREPGVSAWIDLQLWPAARGFPLVVVETTPAAGIRFRPLTRGRLSLDMGALLGLKIHTARFRESVSSPDFVGGNFYDVSTELATGISLRLWGQTELVGLLRAGWAGRERFHIDGEQILWQRSAWRIGGTLGLNFGWQVGT